jgi:hypothetical protein
MNDLDRRMDNVDLNRGRGASVGEYNSKQRRTHAPRPPLLIPPCLVWPIDHQDRNINNPRWRLRRPTWVRRVSDIHPANRGIRPPHIRQRGLATPTRTVLPLRSAAQLVAPSRRLYCRVPGHLRPTLWVVPLGCIARARVPPHPFPVECRTGIDPVPLRPILWVGLPLGSIARDRVPRHPFPEEHLLPLMAGSSLASHTLIPFRGPRFTAVVRS